jgi:hypothetical protein
MKLISNKLCLIFLLFTFGCQFAEPTDYILQSKKEGWYAIVYDCKDGMNKKYVDERLQYVFPESRILIASYSEKFGIVNQRFFYFEDGKKKEFFMPSDKNGDKKFLVWGPTQVNNSEFDKTIFYFGKDYDDKNNKDFHDFVYYVDEYIKQNGIKCGNVSN